MNNHYHNQLLTYTQKHGLSFGELCKLVDGIVFDKIQTILKDYHERYLKAVMGLQVMLPLNNMPATYDSLSSALEKILQSKPMTVEDLAKQVAWPVPLVKAYLKDQHALSDSGMNVKNPIGVLADHIQKMPHAKPEDIAKESGLPLEAVVHFWGRAKERVAARESKSGPADLTGSWG